MINSFLKKQSAGVVTLVVAMILVFVSTLIIIFAANYGVVLNKISGNQSRSAQAFSAAEAGMEFGIQYLKQNSATIVGSPVGGFIPAFSNSSTTNVVLGNNSRYSITYANPIANNYQLIRITSTGTSDDGSSTRVISQLVKFGSILQSAPSTPLISKGTASLGGNSLIMNLTGNQTVRSGSTVSITGNGMTTSNSGGSSAGNIGSDIQQNQSALSSLSANDFFASYFGVGISQAKSNTTYYYENSSNTDYSSLLSGKTGSIWIEQTGGTANINGNVTIGTSSNPVLLIVNGNLNISGNVTLYGFVFTTGTSTQTTTTGNITLVGGIVSASNFSNTGNSTILYSSSVLTNIQNSSTMMYYAKVPGSWRDF